jgi:RNA polymerase primary sigma factor
MRQLKISQKITDRTSSKAFAQYLMDVRAIKSFETADEEYQCAIKAFNGDSDALNELIERNLKFVISVAKQYTNAKSPLEELVNEGNYGLIEAAQKFDPSRGFKFISYAVWYIRKNVTDYMNKYSRTVRIPINRITELNKLKREMSGLEQINQRPTAAQDLVGLEGSDLNFDNINMLLSLDTMSVMSLDTPFTSDSDSGSMIDVLENGNSLSADHLVNNNDLQSVLDSIMTTLDCRQKEIITLTYGLNGYEPLSLVEIGHKVDMSREGVRQVRKKALKIMKINMNRRGIKMELFQN